MMRYFRLATILLVLVFCAGPILSLDTARAMTAAEIDREARSALERLYAKSSSAKVMGEKAVGILVFPNIVKGGFIVGGQFGEGALLKGGKTAGYYNNVQASFGLQIGVQKYGYALFFMTDKAMNWLDKSDGWEIGIGPSIVIVDIGAASSTTTTTAQAEIYAFFFDQRGLMAGLGLQGTKITKIEK